MLDVFNRITKMRPATRPTVAHSYFERIQPNQTNLLEDTITCAEIPDLEADLEL